MIEAEIVTAIKEAIDAADAAWVPSGVEVVWADEKFVGSQSIGAVAVVDNIERVDDVAFAFAHFFAVGSINVAVI